MIYGNDMAFPDPARMVDQSYCEMPSGMSLRTFIATNNLKGILSKDYPYDGLTKEKAYAFVNDAVFLADELINALNQPQDIKP